MSFFDSSRLPVTQTVSAGDQVPLFVQDQGVYMSSSLNTIASYVTSTIQSDAAPADTFYFVDSVDELRTVSKADFKYVATKGYYSAGSGGGGAYWYDATDVTSLDNGFNIIVAIDGGRWKLIIDKPDVKQAGAKGDGVTNDTMSIQTVIDYVHLTGGGTVYLTKGNYKVTATASTESFWFADVNAKTVTNTQTCIIVRSGVTLMGDGPHATEIFGGDRSKTIISLVSMDGGGLRDITICSNWNATTNTGVGHGVFASIWELGDYNKNIVIDNVVVHSVGSYGIGMQWGYYLNNRFNNIHVYNVGADAIDHKVRGGAVETATSRGVSFSNILVEQYGRRSGIVTSAGIDIRGPAVLTNITVKDYGWSGTTNVGLRLNAGTGGATVQERRDPSSFSTLSNFQILSNSTYPTKGLVLWYSSCTTVANGTIKGCTTDGVVVECPSLGYDHAIGTIITGVSVWGCRTGTSFRINPGANYISFVNCLSSSEMTTFEKNGENLVAGQTIFSVDVDPATAKVLKNDIELTVSVDYTITATELTLTSGVLLTDAIRVIYPTSFGFYVHGTNAQITNCATYYNIVPLLATTTEYLTLRLANNDFGFSGIRIVENLDIPQIEPFGTAENIDLRLIGKGTGGVELRGNGNRALRAENITADCVNWVSVQGSATGNPTSVQAEGSDSNIDLYLVPKGAGKIQFGAWTSNVDAAINGYIEIKDSSGNSIKLATIA